MLNDEQVAPDNSWTWMECLALAVPLVTAAISVGLLMHFWDDGAITAAFAKTYLQTGRYALTPLSVEVEGFSSLLWMHLLTLPFRAMAGSAGNFLIWMKVLSGFCFAATLLALRNWLRAARVPRVVRGWTLLLTASVSTPVIEVLNGMEMNLAAFLCVAIAIAVWRDSKLMRCLLVLLVCALVATRFEALFTVVALSVATLAARRPRVLALLQLCAGVVTFGVLEVWRYRRFQCWMPNTVYAKRWMPYTVSGISGALHSRVNAELEILTVLGVVLVGAVILAASRPDWLRSWANLPVVRFALTMSGAAVCFQFLLGENWGHAGRMVAQYLPFLVFVGVSAVYASAAEARTRPVLLVLWTAQVCVALLYTYDRAFLSPPIKVEAPFTEGQRADQVRAFLGRPELTLMTPDIGGVGLCCTSLRVVDSAMLANPPLARKGWRYFPQHINEVRPDLIESHGMWSDASGIYEQAAMQEYQPALLDGQRFLVRRDLATEMLARGARLERNRSDFTCVDTDGGVGQNKIYGPAALFGRLQANEHATHKELLALMRAGGMSCLPGSYNGVAEATTAAA